MPLHELLRELLTRRVSDIHLQGGAPPLGRSGGQLQSFGTQPLAHADVLALARSLLTPEEFGYFEDHHQYTAAVQVKGLGRWRCHVFRQAGAVTLALRTIGVAVPSLASLGLPTDLMTGLALAPRGLLLFVGPGDSGRTTSAASVVDHRNRHTRSRIVTVEDPPEYLYAPARSLVAQRAVGQDVPSAAQALAAARVQDADLVFVGELRAAEEVRAALEAAQSGRLVVSTFLARDSVHALTRLGRLFAPQERADLRADLAETLLALVGQRLVPGLFGGDRVLAHEVLPGTPEVRAALEGESPGGELRALLATGQTPEFHPLDAHLAALVRQQRVSPEAALAAASDPTGLRARLAAPA
ncbi:type IV pilus twitching motility protein PilT [Deinococcus petrolearius]|uniref:Type IV pilus twitching motility protein PilT n=1 Tax=Deinococcus petrolearius TaxID=1751295 RepID=A0ABW1DIE5_9DEIO